MELLVRLTPDLLGRDWPTRETLQGFAALLSAEDAFAGMSWHDARHAAAAILCDATNRGHPAGFLRGRADRALAGSDAITWDDPAATARAFTVTATLLVL
ncbi:hypothetical protein BST45_07055 [Mycobacterium shinjukuense]|nr:hypothetical protein BST45_07055 [Mycobacterium shinjukuense]